MTSNKILIVDDAKTIRQQVNFTLVKAGFEVIEAVDGVDGIAKLKENKDIKAIISDINMPNMDGFQMVASIKGDSSLAQPPILILTTEGANDMILKAKQAGASGWIVKPFKPEILVEAVKKLIG
ncbi:response regulator [Spirobacillus cienkowskii]|jgi:two-component system chemotaxis response regulator CheY|uniref:Response regulator n=1 Tax=Spirobacillus cienkowskii TaxID=495820 RepID=A0A369KQS0_9BACT|nr:MAG: response regulator [Spirobacillus cienkowskii]